MFATMIVGAEHTSKRRDVKRTGSEKPAKGIALDLLFVLGIKKSPSFGLNCSYVIIQFAL